MLREMRKMRMREMRVADVVHHLMDGQMVTSVWFCVGRHR
jgi:hypothetical protein